MTHTRPLSAPPPSCASPGSTFSDNGAVPATVVLAPDGSQDPNRPKSTNDDRRSMSFGDNVADHGAPGVTRAGRTNDGDRSADPAAVPQREVVHEVVRGDFLAPPPPQGERSFNPQE